MAPTPSSILGKAETKPSGQSRHFIKGSLYFGLMSLLLLIFMFFGSQTLATLGYFKNSAAPLNYSFKDAKNLNSNELFFNQNKSLSLETPDLKIIQGDFIYGISTPRVLTTQTLGDIFGEASQERKDVTSYTVQPGDTIESVAQSFNISANTVIWANNLSKNSSLKAGQDLVILPVSGVVHIVKSGDTIDQISKTYKAKADDIIVLNNLANEGDIFIGDILIIPDGTMPLKSVPLIETPLSGSSWIYPLLRFKQTQGLHFFNAVDISSLDGCGSSVYAVAAGTVQRVVGNGKWNLGMGNYVTILHPNGVVTYYGHLKSVLVKSGDRVTTGDRIGLEGSTGSSTGCHVHFQVMGAANYIAQRVRPGQIVDVTKR